MAITFKIVPLGINAPSPTILHRKERNVGATFLNCVQHCLRFALDRLDGVESATLQAPFEFGEEEEVTRGHVGGIRRVWNKNCSSLSQKLACAEGVVSRCIVVMQDPVPVAPQRWSLATDVFSETPQNRESPKEISS